MSSMPPRPFGWFRDSYGKRKFLLAATLPGKDIDETAAREAVS